MKRGPLWLTLAVLAAAPCAGGWPADFFTFPPLLHKAHPAPAFNAVVFSLYAFLALWAALPLAAPRWFGFRPHDPPATSRPPRTFPLHGGIGLLLVLLAWLAAWTQPAWLGALRHYTFAPLWLGYVLTVDALVYRREGRSRLSDRPREFALLFPASALIWWYFEFLNRFVKNWWYEGAEVFSAAGYILFAALCFSTVLPSILVTSDLLLSFPGLRGRYARGPAMKPWKRGAVWAAGFGGAAGLALLARRPEPLFALTWLAPLVVVAAGLALAGGPTPLHPLGRGDWTSLLVPALAALVCGVFWEMWNFLALPKWHYAVPYVQTLHVFEMPLVGFLGYLPFGPLCWCLWSLLAGLFGRRTILPGDNPG